MPTWEEFFLNQPAQISVWGIIINLLIAAILAFILGRIYISYGDAMSNRRIFARNFIILAMTTALIIMVIKSSLALALGMVGALSIVRFRAAIKEPEELIYLFVCISIGVGLGADQRIVTVIAFVAIALAIVFRKLFTHREEEGQNLHLTISSSNPGKIELEQVVSILKEFCSSVSLKRVDETNDMLEATFLVDFSDYQNLEQVRSELAKLSESVKITFLDTRGVY